MNGESEQKENVIEKEVEELGLKIPKTNEPFIIRVIALVLAVGGFSLLASVFTDIFNSTTTFTGQISRLFSGAFALFAAYELIKRKFLAVWLIGLFVFFGLLVNPVLTFFLGLILVYLIIQRRNFEPGYLDALARQAWEFLKSLGKKSS